MKGFDESTLSKDMRSLWNTVEDVQDVYLYNRLSWVYIDYLETRHLVFYEEAVTGSFSEERRNYDFGRFCWPLGKYGE